jgi:hypothetical protein
MQQHQQTRTGGGRKREKTNEHVWNEVHALKQTSGCREPDLGNTENGKYKFLPRGDNGIESGNNELEF